MCTCLSVCTCLCPWVFVCPFKNLMSAFGREELKKKRFLNRTLSPFAWNYRFQIDAEPIKRVDALRYSLGLQVIRSWVYRIKICLTRRSSANKTSCDCNKDFSLKTLELCERPYSDFSTVHLAFSFGRWFVCPLVTMSLSPGNSCPLWFTF